MKINIIIGNPPYQKASGGGSYTESSEPLYNDFVEMALEKASDNISMVIPSRWLSGGKSVLDGFRTKMVQCGHLETVVTVGDSLWVFDNVDIAGGIMWFNLNKNINTDTVEFTNISKNGDRLTLNRKINGYKYKDPNNNEQLLVVTDNKAISIIEKTLSIDNIRLSDVVLPSLPFGLATDFKDSDVKTESKPIRVVTSAVKDDQYTDLGNITKNEDLLDTYKVVIGRLDPGGGHISKNGQQNCITVPKIINIGDACTSTFLVLWCTKNIEEAENFEKFIRTKFIRFLMLTTYSGIHIISRNCMFVPVLDYSIEWTDEMLYKRYGLTDDEINYIESRIKTL